MSKEPDLKREQHWRKVLHACEASGQTIRAYCRGR